MKKLSKLLISFLSVIVLMAGFVSPLNAQSPAPSTAPGPWYNQNYVQWSSKVFDTTNPNEIFGERYTFAQVNWILNSLIAVIIGSDISNCIGLYNTGNLTAVGECLKKFNIDPTKAVGNAGAIGGLASLTNNLLNMKPASGIQYFKSTATKFHIIPQAYAQTGVGFATLTPVQSLWGVLRNISYSLMVVVIIIMAFMIMFRVKISPQVVVTVQSALPRIAMALILITFSYAIAGFLVDLMYVIVGAFATAIKIGGSSISNASVGYLFNQLISGNGLVSIILGITIFAFLLALVGAGLTIVGGVGSVAFLGLPLPILVGGVVLLVFAVFLLVILFRIFWLMVQTAVQTVLLIIGGPIMILLGTFSASGGFQRWIRSVLGNLAVYPTVIIMIFLSHYFFWGWFVGGFLTGALSAFTPFNTFDINVWNMGNSSPVGDSAPIVNLPGMPIRTNIMGFILSFVLLFLIPRAAHVIEALINGKTIDQASAIKEGVAPLMPVYGLGRQAAIGAVGFEIGSRAAEAAEAARGGNPRASSIFSGVETWARRNRFIP